MWMVTRHDPAILERPRIGSAPPPAVAPTAAGALDRGHGHSRFRRYPIGSHGRRCARGRRPLRHLDAEPGPAGAAGADRRSGRSLARGRGHKRSGWHRGIAGGHPDEYANPDSNSSSGAAARAHGLARTGRHADPDTGPLVDATDSVADTKRGSDAHAHAHSDTNADSLTDPHAEPNANAHPHRHSDFHAHPEPDPDSDTQRGPDREPDARPAHGGSPRRPAERPACHFGSPAVYRANLRLLRALHFPR